MDKTRTKQHETNGALIGILVGLILVVAILLVISIINLVKTNSIDGIRYDNSCVEYGSAEHQARVAFDSRLAYEILKADPNAKLGDYFKYKFC